MLSAANPAAVLATTNLAAEAEITTSIALAALFKLFKAFSLFCNLFVGDERQRDLFGGTQTQHRWT